MDVGRMEEGPGREGSRLDLIRCDVSISLRSVAWHWVVWHGMAMEGIKPRSSERGGVLSIDRTRSYIVPYDTAIVVDTSRGRG